MCTVFLAACHAAAAAVQVYYYPGFSKMRDAPKLTAELMRNLTRPTAWEAVMRIRCSRGLKIGSFHGHFFNRR
jgi:protein transport protein SEC24